MIEEIYFTDHSDDTEQVAAEVVLPERTLIEIDGKPCVAVQPSVYNGMLEEIVEGNTHRLDAGRYRKQVSDWKTVFAITYVAYGCFTIILCLFAYWYMPMSTIAFTAFLVIVLSPMLFVARMIKQAICDDSDLADDIYEISNEIAQEINKETISINISAANMALGKNSPFDLSCINLEQAH